MSEPPVFYHRPKPKRLERNRRQFQVDPTRHLGDAQAVAVKFGARGFIPDSWQYAEAVVGLVRAAKDYVSGGRAAFRTLAYRYMTAEILKALKVARNPRRRPPGERWPMRDWAAPTTDADVPGDAEQLPGWLRRLPSLHRRIVEAYYFRSLAMKDIGTEEGLGKARVHKILDDSLTRLRQTASIDPAGVRAVRRKPHKTLLPA